MLADLAARAEEVTRIADVASDARRSKRAVVHLGTAPAIGGVTNIAPLGDGDMVAWQTACRQTGAVTRATGQRSLRVIKGLDRSPARR